MFSEAIEALLRRSVPPLIKIEPSRLAGAGRGIFATQFIAQGSPLCLYPGLFTPGLPFLDDAVYLAAPEETNAYILNLVTTGGYLDGLAIKGLDENPSASAHLANHSSTKDNVEVVSFWWHDMNVIKPASGSFYSIPNGRRNDKSPWFFHDNKIVYLNGAGDTPCAGAAFVASRDIFENEEIYLDYKLKEPLPPWAQGWYNE